MGFNSGFKGLEINGRKCEYQFVTLSA